MEKTIRDKNLIFYIIVIVLLCVLVSVSYLTGYYKGKSNERLKIDGVAMTYTDLTKKVDSYSSEVQDKQKVLKSLQNDINQAKADKEILEKRNTDLDNELAEKQKSLTASSSTDTQKSVTSSSNSKTMKATTLTLDAGTYIIGKNIAPHRYKIDSQGKTGGLFVYDSSGLMKDDAFLTPSISTTYTVELDNGETLKLQISAKLIPVN